LVGLGQHTATEPLLHPQHFEQVELKVSDIALVVAHGPLRLTRDPRLSIGYWPVTTIVLPFGNQRQAKSQQCDPRVPLPRRARRTPARARDRHHGPTPTPHGDTLRTARGASSPTPRPTREHRPNAPKECRRGRSE